MNPDQIRQQYSGYAGWGTPEMLANFKATGGEGKGGPSSGGGVYGAQLGAIDQATDKYINDLIGEAQGDREFIVKKLDAEHKLALGTDDKARAAFLEKVADAVEQRIGRIPYDYERYSARELADYATSSERVARDSSTALKRLQEDEQVIKKQNETQAAQERQDTNTSLNARGILNEKPSEATGLAGKEIGLVEQSITDRMDALGRSVGRQTQDINNNRDDSMFDLGLNKDRTLEDLTVGARRGAITEQNNLNYGTESANRNFDTRKKALEKQRELLKLQNPGYALTGAGY